MCPIVHKPNEVRRQVEGVSFLLLPCGLQKWSQAFRLCGKHFLSHLTVQDGTWVLVFAWHLFVFFNVVNLSCWGDSNFISLIISDTVHCFWLLRFSLHWISPVQSSGFYFLRCNQMHLICFYCLRFWGSLLHIVFL